MSEAILSLGTNIGDRVSHLQNAVDAIRHMPKTRITAISSVYETAPWGYTEQADFYNICVRIETKLSPPVLLGCCLGAEAAMGRLRPFKNAPRIIDIDLILYENFSEQTEELTVPHKEIANRAFVLFPMEEVLKGSKLYYDVESCKKKVRQQRIEKTDISIF